MKEIIINVKMKIQNDLDEQDILDHTSAISCHGMHGGGIVEFIDAELAETPGSAGRQTGIVVIDIIDDLIKVWGELKHDTRNSEEDAAYCRGAENIMKALKRMLEQYNLAELVPAAEVDQVRGENLTQSMRLDKAGKLLDSALHFLTRYSTKYPELVAPAMDIDEFLGGVGK